MRNTVKAIIFCLLSILFASAAVAQKTIDLADVSYSKLCDTGNNAASSFTSVNLKAPVVLNNGDAVILGASYNSFHIDGEFTADFYNVTLPFGYYHRVNSSSNVTTIVLNRLNTDFNTIDKDHFQLGFISTYEQQTSAKFAYRLGLYYNKELSGHLFVPIVGLNWQVTPELSVDGALPQKLNINYNVNDQLATGINFSGQLASYAVGGQEDQYVARSKNVLGGYLEANVSKGIVLQVSGGMLLGTKYQIYNQGDEMDLGLSMVKFGDDRNVISTTAGNGAFIEAKAIYRYKVAGK